MNDFDLLGAVLFQILSQQPAVTLFGRVLATKETRPIESLRAIFAQNISVFE